MRAALAQAMDDVVDSVTVFAASVRNEIADFLSALLTVYVIVIIAWIVLSFIFAMGVRVPYNALVQRGAGLPARHSPTRG